MKSKSTSSVTGLNASRRPSKLGEMLAQKKIDEARRLNPEQRLRVALEHSDAAATLRRTGFKKCLLIVPTAAELRLVNVFETGYSFLSFGMHPPQILDEPKWAGL